LSCMQIATYNSHLGPPSIRALLDTTQLTRHVVRPTRYAITYPNLARKLQ